MKIKFSMPKITSTRIVTLVISGLCVIFAGLITLSYINRDKPSQVATAAQGGSQAPTGPRQQNPQGQGAQQANQGGQGQSAGQAQPSSPQTQGQTEQRGQRQGAGQTSPGGQAQQGPQGQGTPQANQGGQGAGQASPGGQGQQSPQGQANRPAPQARGTAVRITPIKLDTIRNTIIINGDVLARTQVSVFPTVAGKVTEARFRVGDTVRQGQTLAMVDPSRPGDIYSQSAVVSPVSGTVLSAPVNPGDTISTQTAVYIVGDLSSLLVETHVPERFSGSVRRGLGAQVMLEALPNEIFEMLVDEVSPVLDPASRTLRIRLRFTRPDPRIRAGMFATVTLVTNSKENVTVIPRSALINTYGTWIAFTISERNLAVRREVTLGIENEDFVEVLSGLDIGESVVVAGQNFLSDGDPVRIIEG